MHRLPRATRNGAPRWRPDHRLRARAARHARPPLSVEHRIGQWTAAPRAGAAVSFSLSPNCSKFLATMARIGHHCPGRGDIASRRACRRDLMLSVYVPHGASLERIEVGQGSAVPESAIWFDLFTPT